MGQSYGSIDKLKGLPLPNTQSAFRAKPHQSHRSTLEKGTREGHRPCDVISFGEVKVPRVLSPWKKEDPGNDLGPSLRGGENPGNEVV